MKRLALAISIAVIACGAPPWGRRSTSCST